MSDNWKQELDEAISNASIEILGQDNIKNDGQAQVAIAFIKAYGDSTNRAMIDRAMIIDQCFSDGDNRIHIILFRDSEIYSEAEILLIEVYENITDIIEKAKTRSVSLGYKKMPLDLPMQSFRCGTKLLYDFYLELYNKVIPMVSESEELADFDMSVVIDLMSKDGKFGKDAFPRFMPLMKIILAFPNTAKKDLGTMGSYSFINIKDCNVIFKEQITENQELKEYIRSARPDPCNNVSPSVKKMLLEISLKKSGIVNEEKHSMDIDGMDVDYVNECVVPQYFSTIFESGPGFLGGADTKDKIRMLCNVDIDIDIDHLQLNPLPGYRLYPIINIETQLDNLKPSPLLGYMLNPILKEYKIDPSISVGEGIPITQERFMMDVMGYIVNQNNQVLSDVFGSIALITEILYTARLTEMSPVKLACRSLGVPVEPDDLDLLSLLNINNIDLSRLDGHFIIRCASEPFVNVRRLLEQYEGISRYEVPPINSKAEQIVISTNQINKYQNIQDIIEKLEREVSKSQCSEVQTVLLSLYTLTGQIDEAIKIYQIKLRNETMVPYDYYNLGTIYLIRNDTEKAREQFSIIMELEQARYHIGLSYLYEQKWSEASLWLNEFAHDYKDNIFEHSEPRLLEHYIKQFSCNNLGICKYKGANRIREGATEALDFFYKATSWTHVTIRWDGVFNVQLMTGMLRDLAGESSNTTTISKKHYRDFPGIIGHSDAMQEIYTKIEQIARIDSNVLITGESGTGKELVARAIHDNSSRKDKPFIFLNSSAIPKELIESELFGHEKGAFTSAGRRKKGVFELANDGTLFLDEIGDISLEAQAKLLRAAEYGDIKRVGAEEFMKVNTRIIAATNKDLKKAIQDGEFREDLYYRLDVSKIHVPPLRDRKEDIPLLIESFLEKIRNNRDRRLTLSDPAMEILKEFNWPGNVRQLKSAIESSANRADGKIIHSWDLPEEICKELESDTTTDKMRIIEAYMASNGNATKAISRLGMPKSTFYYKVEQYGINLDAIKTELKKHN